MNKRHFAEHVRQYGCTSHYSGNTQTMYIRGKNAEEAIKMIMPNFRMVIDFSKKFTEG